ncbi:MAG: sigma 54-interacting transcriptional regulator [Desulfoprunum sp.]|nr:sigma 54-interacting transcriptional regulator [Desulfoprunum sp.]
MKKELIEQNLQRSVLFKDINLSDLTTYSEVSRVQIVPQGEFVYRQGDASEVFYVIAMGDAEMVLERKDGGNSIVGRIGPGGHFGETGLLTGKPHSVSVRALCDLVLICFDKRLFRTLLLSNTLIHRQLDLALAERLRVAFLDQADTACSQRPTTEASGGVEDVILFKEKNPSQVRLKRLTHHRPETLCESKSARKTHIIINRFATNNEPYMLTGETGTGKIIIARQIHLQSGRGDGPYLEIDLRENDPIDLYKKLVGTEQSAFPFAQARQAGIFEQTCGGTLVFSQAHLMPVDLQQKLARIIQSSTFTHTDSDRQIALQSRIVFLCTQEIDYLESTGKFIPELLEIFKKQHFLVPSLREHKRDLPRLIDHYLERFSKEYGKKIRKVSPETLGILMNYDWPGNLTELSSVMRRAVMLARRDEILSDQILLGLPKTEGKWEFNVLRLPWVQRFLKSATFPRVPQIIVGGILLLAVVTLFFGPDEAGKNIGITLSWSIGWPLMFFSFFFLARTWCSVCTLAMPGMLMQDLIKPQRKLPEAIKNASGWIMAMLCILVLWVEIVWNAYEDPFLTGWIILTITVGSLLTSIFYSRRAWCRYLCPLGAINAIFAMPSIVELRANRHVCLNRCQDHACFAGGEENVGCPMFRHPYLVDNNRDCIFCAACIKSCTNQSIHLNLRLAPQELWSIQTPRWEDSFLIVSLGAIFFPFALHQNYAEVVEWLRGLLLQRGLPLPNFVIGSLGFFSIILIFQIVYYLMVQAQARYLKIERKTLLALLGYGFIPLILGGYMAVHLEFFVNGSWRLILIIKDALGLETSSENIRLISRDSTIVLQTLTILGGLFASMYATYRIIDRLLDGEHLGSRMLIMPYGFLVTLTVLFLWML